MLHEDRAIATNLARKKATPLQSAKKLAIKLNKGLGWMKHQSRTVPLELHGTPLTTELEIVVEPASVSVVCKNSAGHVEVLIVWKDLPPCEATWESFDKILQ
ncbi:Chromo domain-like [Trema orientale]|uniref:Chromo domain-like n=1 Tax=Trema orientale TaxID=63057 RepID=A0A2P5DF44_TREOI|nr:Chromo domain-like [Trema orientale]